MMYPPVFVMMVSVVIRLWRGLKFRNDFFRENALTGSGSKKDRLNIFRLALNFQISTKFRPMHVSTLSAAH